MDTKDIETVSDEEIEQMAPPEIKEDEPAQEPVEGTAPATTEEPVEESSGSETEEKVEEGAEASEAPAIDYKQFYDTLMSPIKANGKEMRVRDAGEVVKLMQMGANYTQKMQTLAPYRKKIQMLKNAGLFDDDNALNQLIDIAHGNPDAISKLLKDRNIDPLDMNVSEESKYVPSNHSVSDEEMAFQSVLDDLKSTPEGRETLSIVNGMDQASLSEVWKTPSLMSTLDEQRQSGVYKLITDEMDHQKMLGNIPEGTPFLQAYKAVGDYLLQQQNARQQQALPKGTLNRPVSQVASQVRAAAPTGRSKKPNQTFVDPFSLSDEDFEKQFKDYIG